MMRGGRDAWARPPRRLTVLLATLSWYLIEKPVNNLKDRFSY